MAFASVISSNGGSEGNSTAPSFTLPTPISAGNLILVFAGTDNTATFTVPSGYTAISQQDATEFQVAVFGKIADGTEDSTTVDGTLSATESSCYIALCIQDWSGSLDDVEVETIAQSQIAEAVNPSGVTASWGADDNLFIAVAIADFWNETATGFPTGFTDNQLTQQHVNQFGGTQAISLASKESASATEDPDAFTYSATPGNWAAFTTVIKPAAASGPTLSSVPATAYPGQSRTITTTGTGASQGTGGVTLGGVAQTVTAWSDTSITFTTVQGGLKFQTGLTLEVTTDGGQAASDTMDLIVEPGTGGYVNVTDPAVSDESSLAYQFETAGGDPVATGDQCHWRYTGVSGDPTDLTAAASTLITDLDQEGEVEVRFWDATDSTWGSFATVNAAEADTTAPTFTSVDVPTAGSYKAGDNLEFTANASETVTVTGTPQLPITIGGTIRQTDYVSGTQALLFRYTVQAGDNDANGISVGSAISLNGGSIADAAANNANLTLNSIGDTSGVLVDTVKPVITPVGGSTVNVVVGESYTDQGATAFDDQDGSLGTVTGTGSVDTDTIGEYTITYPGAGVVDSAGNVADDATRTVNVVAEPPAVSRGLKRAIGAQSTKRSLRKAI